MHRTLTTLLAIGLAAPAAALAQSAEREDLPPAAETFQSDELERLSAQSELDALAPTEEAAVVEPISVTLRALDKVVARYTDIIAPINEKVRFGTLEIVARTCYKRPPEEFPETTAFLEIGDFGLDGVERNPADAVEDEIDPIREAEDLDAADGLRFVADDEDFDPASVPPGPGGDTVFTGWMFASSPALNPLEHPVYDVWVIDCAQRTTEVAPEEGAEADAASDSTNAASQ
ncbi:MAG: DUF2155 domain-containing protein [Pseudomonadota bacterium]